MPVAISCTDSAGNTYVHLASMRSRATHAAPSYQYDGANVEVFWCQSAATAMSETTSPPFLFCPAMPTSGTYFLADWDENTYNRCMFAIRYRGHTGDPFQIVHYGDDSVPVMESDRVMAPTGSLPTWTFARTGGVIHNLLWAEPADGYGEPEAGGAGFRQDAAWGGVYGTSSQASVPGGGSNWISATLAFYSPSSAGTTSGLQPGWINDTNVSHLPVYNNWKALVAWGIERSASAGSLDWKVAAFMGRTCLHDKGFNWLTRIGPSSFFAVDVAVGDGILVFAASPDNMNPIDPASQPGKLGYYKGGAWHLAEDE